MTSKFLISGSLAGLLLAAGCNGSNSTDGPAATPSATPAADSTEPSSATSTPAASSGLDAILAGDWRPANQKARDEYRNPAETLAFFEVEPNETVIEIWPGGGWYTNILAPYLKDGGTYIAALPAAEAGDYYQRAVDKFETDFVARTDVYGDIQTTTLWKTAGPLAEEGSVDTILTFRNVHNWMNSEFADKAFADMYAALKPGGVLGVVEHSLPSSEPQNPIARDGYVHEDFVISLAEDAGFVLVESSDINANPADTADHPFGVWTLPPVSRTTDRDGNTPEGFDPQTYLDIGESNRMTLKFRKPTAEEIAAAAEEAEAETEE